MPANSFDHWIDGFPFCGVDDGTNPNGSMNFWDQGFPYIYIFSTAGTPPSGTPRNYGFIIG